ncbi:MAG: hypothetical protein GY820_44150 [Gammaproteobacteria bacterium]|nr:hypothetical protein [Gammaproteobacteria bacterium]
MSKLYRYRASINSARYGNCIVQQRPASGATIITRQLCPGNSETYIDRNQFPFDLPGFPSHF